MSASYATERTEWLLEDNGKSAQKIYISYYESILLAKLYDMTNPQTTIFF